MEKIIVAFLMLPILFIGCLTERNHSDVEKIQSLQKKYKNSCEFEIKQDSYLLVIDKTSTGLLETQLEGIYQEFVPLDSNSINNSTTSIVYLNYYNRSREFQYQIYFDRQKREFVRSETEAY